MPEELRKLEEEASERATDEDLDKAAAAMLKNWMKSFEVPKFLVASEADLEVSEPEDLGGQPDSGARMVPEQALMEEILSIRETKETDFPILSAVRVMRKPKQMIRYPRLSG